MSGIFYVFLQGKGSEQGTASKARLVPSRCVPEPLLMVLMGFAPLPRRFSDKEGFGELRSPIYIPNWLKLFSTGRGSTLSLLLL